MSRGGVGPLAGAAGAELVITTAAAAVTAGVVLKKHPPAEAVVQRIEASRVLAGPNAAPAAPGSFRRVRRVAGSLEAAGTAVRIGTHVDQRRPRPGRYAV